MAGTSGCKPDYHVNFFGRLCVPAPRPSAVTDGPSEVQSDIDSQVDCTPEPHRTSMPASQPGTTTEAFEGHQHLIRGFSLGGLERYLATVTEVHAKVRQDRASACLEQPQEQQLAEDSQVDHYHEHRAEYQANRDQTKDQDQHVQEQHQEQHQNQHQPQHQQQPQPGSQSLREQPATAKSSLRPSKNEHAANAPRQSRLQREEDAMFYIEETVHDGEIVQNELLWLDALLMANFTGDPRRKYGFVEERCGE